MEKLKRLREERGLSQVKLAARADLNPATVNQIERGMRDASPGTLRKLADALEVSLYELMEEEAPKDQAPLPLELEEQGGADERRRSVYLEVFKKHMTLRASAWERHANEESSRFFSDWRTSAAYAAEVSKEAYVLTRTAVKELSPAIDQDPALEDAVREQRELVDAVKNMLKAVEKVSARDAATLEHAIQEDIDHRTLEEARAEKEKLAKERRAAFALLDGRLSA